jgi:hypothetical protein
MEEKPIVVGGLKETFAKNRHGGLDMLESMLADGERFHIVVPGVDDVDGLEIPAQINREIYNACSAVARDLRLADSKEIDDEALVEEIKNKIVKKEDLEFYVAYLFLTETFEYEKRQTVEFSPVSEDLGKYVLKVMVDRVKTSSDVKDFKMVKDVVMRMTVGLPSGFSGDTYFGVGEYDDIWKAVSGREKELINNNAFNEVFTKLHEVDEKVKEYMKEHRVVL